MFPFKAPCGFGVGTAAASSLITAKAAGIMEALLGAEVPVKHLDETGLRVEGRLRWLRVTCSNLMSLCRLDSARGDVPRDIKGIAVHDNMPS